MRRLALAALLLVTACSPRPATPEQPEAAVGPIYAAGEERGYLEPCGCTRPQLGGLARKGTALAGAPLIENGDLVDSGGRLAELKFETFLLALSEIGCRALNVGEGDLELGLDFLRSAAGLASFPLISANLRDGHGRAVFPPTAEIAAADGTARITVIGLLDPALAPGHEVADPAGALREALAAIPPENEVVLLFHGTRSAASSLLTSNPRISRAIYAHGGGEPAVDSPKLATPGDRSRWILRLADRPEVVELAESFENDKRMERALATYVRRLEEEDLLHRMNPMAPPEHGGYVGDRACAGCHEASDRIHSNSHHARAIKSLEKTGRHVDPDCVVCHVVGYGQETGFLSLVKTPELARVGCESCHGPGADHTASPRNRTAGNARAACLDCHTADTDPAFDFEKKWPRIRHR